MAALRGAFLSQRATCCSTRIAKEVALMLKAVHAAQEDKETVRWESMEVKLS